MLINKKGRESSNGNTCSNDKIYKKNEITTNRILKRKAYFFIEIPLLKCLLYYTHR